MASDRDAQAVKFVKPDVVYRSSLPVSQDDGFTDYLCLSLAEFGQDGGRSRFDGWHDRAHGIQACVTRGGYAAKGCRELSQPEFDQAADGFVHKPMIAPIRADVKPLGVGPGASVRMSRF